MRIPALFVKWRKQEEEPFIPTIYLLLGPPASGKTAWREQKRLEDYRHYIVVQSFTIGRVLAGILMAQKYKKDLIIDPSQELTNCAVDDLRHGIAGYCHLELVRFPRVAMTS